MKILVCISKAPDTTTKITFTDSNTKFNKDKVTYIVNPYDEWYALVRALEIKEANGGSVTTITVGTNEDDAIIRKALAIGADDAVRVNAEADDAFFVASQIAEYAKQNGFDLVMAGKETIDYNGGEVAPMVAELMDVPSVTFVSKLDVADGKATAERDIPGGVEVVEFSLPAVISAAKGLAEQRIPNMRGIMQARSKALNVIEPFNNDKLTEVVEYSLPEVKSACTYFEADQMEELVNALHNEAKVI